MGYEARLMRVAKMHGARNDFVVVDARNEPLGDPASFARWACDRRAGIGADGCILLASSRVADIRMRTINADGSEAEMCGNGVRCAARWLDEAGEGERIAFETEAGVVQTEIIAREPEYLVRVTMGAPRVERLSPAVLSEASFVEIGNPHVVVFRSDLAAIDLEGIAVGLQKMPLFSGGTNVHVAVAWGERTLRVRHWERGVGVTMACGTGAVACAAAGIERGLVASPVEVLVPGGRLSVQWDGSDAYLTGPAVRVFNAEVGVGAASLR
jgi:diaminopimelate epimerase